MTLTDELKILDGKIKENQPQYNLDREADKMSALDEYEYFTGEDLGYKPGVIRQSFNKRIKKE